MRRFLSPLTPLALALPLATLAQLDPVHAPSLPASTAASATTTDARPTARGIVFVDENGDGKYQGPGRLLILDRRGTSEIDEIGEPGIGGVVVTSTDGEVAVTAKDGTFELPVDDDTIVFLIKPRGHMVPLNEHNIPRYYHIHKPKGSPSLYYGGVQPTGPLPERLEFPLTPQDESQPYNVVLMADPQPETGQEVDYIRVDALSEIAEVPSLAFGMTLGDIMFDQLDLWPTYNQNVGAVGVPWWNVIGNHDLNYDSLTDEFSDETFNRHFGPQFFAFHWGKVFFVALDNIHWKGGGKQPNQGSYDAQIEREQVEWLRKVLPHVPDDALIVIGTHAPLIDIANEKPAPGVEELSQALSGRTSVLAVNGHTHLTDHHRFGPAEGYTGEGTFHHYNIATVSGSWWSGPKDSRGVPNALQRDGTPNGYVILSIDGNTYTSRFKAASEPATHQIAIYPPGKYAGEGSGQTLLVNVFDGAPNGTAEFSVNGGDWQPLTYKPRRDPAADAFYEGANDQGKSWVNPVVSTHMWEAPLNRDAFRRGANLLRARYRDQLGRENRELTGAVIVRY